MCSCVMSLTWFLNHSVSKPLITVIEISPKQNSSVQLLSKIGSVMDWNEEELMDETEKVFWVLVTAE